MQVNQTPDAVLIERFVTGDKEAMDMLISRHLPRISAYAMRLSRDRDMADDVVSDTFMRANRSVAGFEGRGAFGTWLHTLTRNCYFDLRKKALSRPTESLNHPGRLEDPLERQLVSAAPSPYDLAEGLARSEVLMAAIAKLSESHRPFIELFHLQMLTYEEISELLSIPVGTVKSRIHRARAALKHTLDSERFLLGSETTLAA